MITQYRVEQHIIASIVNDYITGNAESWNVIYEVMEHLTPADFHAEDTREIYTYLIRAATELKTRNQDDILMFLTHSLQGRKDDLVHKVIDWISAMPSGANIGFWIETIQCYNNLRRIRMQCHVTGREIAGGNVDLDRHMSDLETMILNIQNRNHDNPLLGKIAEETYDFIMAPRSNEGLAGYSWGLKDIDEITSGIERKKTYVVGGLKKSGKTKFLINTQFHLWNHGVATGWVSMEMASMYLMRWLFSRFCEIDSDHIKKGNLTPDEQVKLESCVDMFRQYEDMIQIDDRPGLTIPQIGAVMRRMAVRGARVIFLDYLQISDFSTYKESRPTQLQMGSNDLAKYAKKYDVALVFLSQIRNEGEGRICHIGDLKESGGIGESVECALILNNLDRIRKKNNDSNRGLFKIVQRDGASDDAEVQLSLNIQKFSDLVPTEETEKLPNEVDF